MQILRISGEGTPTSALSTLLVQMSNINIPYCRVTCPNSDDATASNDAAAMNIPARSKAQTSISTTTRRRADDGGGDDDDADDCAETATTSSSARRGGDFVAPRSRRRSRDPPASPDESSSSPPTTDSQLPLLVECMRGVRALRKANAGTRCYDRCCRCCC